MPPARLNAISGILKAKSQVTFPAPQRHVLPTQRRDLSCTCAAYVRQPSRSLKLRPQPGEQREKQKPAKQPRRISKLRPSRAQFEQKEENDEDEDERIKFFEATLGEKPSIRRIPNKEMERQLEKEDEFPREMQRRSEDLLQRLQEREKLSHPARLADALFNAIFTKEDLEMMSNPVPRKLTPEQENEMQEKFEKKMNPDGKPMGMLQPYFVIPRELPDATQRILSHLSNAMDNAGDPKPKSEWRRVRYRKALWKYYERCKMYLPNLPSILPSHAWRLLWRIQAEESSKNPNRLSHLKTLAEDMLLAGQPLTREQRFARLEGMFLQGQHQRALEQYEVALKDDGDGGNAEFLEMGIRMHCMQGDLRRAEDLFDVLFKLHPESDPRIMLPFIHSCASMPDRDRAWALYMRLRERLGSDMTADDYDHVSMSFLQGGQTDLALAVFRDMMVSVDNADGPSTSTFQPPADRFGEFISLSKDVQEVNKMSLMALSYLPRSHQNKFFYGKWIKRLMGIGDNESAAQVIELMCERNVTPDSRHLNELLYAWLVRGGTEKQQERAQAIGFHMIQRRLRAVHQRKLKRTPDLELLERSIYTGAPSDMPGTQEKPFPPATIETYTILAEYFLRRAKFDYVRHLRDLLFYSEIPMNSYFMNNLLFAERRNHGVVEAWNRFQVMTRNVTPDLQSFSCLWDCMKDLIDQDASKAVQGSSRTGFPSARELFARMLNWFALLDGRDLEAAKTDMTTNIRVYNQIVRSFVRTQDIAGAFVAVHALKMLFNTFPVQSTIRMLHGEIYPSAKKKPEPESPARWFQVFRRPTNVQRTPQKVFGQILRRRQEDLKALGEVLEEWDANEGAEEISRTVLEFLYTMTILQRQSNKSDMSIEDHINRVAEKMNVEPFDVKGAFVLYVRYR